MLPVKRTNYNKYYIKTYQGRVYVKQPPKKVLGVSKKDKTSVVFESFATAAKELNTTKNSISVSISRGTSLKGYYLSKITD